MHKDNTSGYKGVSRSREGSLRICTHKENQRNMKMHKDNTSGYKGVSRSRERLNLGEVSMNVDALLPYVDNMLNERQKAVTKINEKYDTDISVSLNSSWNLEHENFETLVENTDPDPDKSGTDTEQSGTETEQSGTEQEQTGTETEQSGTEMEKTETETETEKEKEVENEV